MYNNSQSLPEIAMLNTVSTSTLSLKDLLTHTVNAEMVNFWAEKLNPLWRIGQPVAKIVSRQVSAKDTVTLLLAPNKYVQKPQAGQHLMVGAEVQGVRIARSYSSSSIPNRPNLLSITVKQVSGGKLSQWLCQQAKVGDVLFLGQPFGEFTWPEQHNAVMLLAAGSGITPMISLLRQHVTQKSHSKQPVQLHYWVSEREQACFVDELLALQKIQPQFSFYLHLTRQASQHAHEQQGRIDSNQLFNELAQSAELANMHVLACGSAGFVTSAQQLLQDRVASWQAEAFSPPKPTPVLDNIAENATVEIRLQQQQRTLTVPVGQSILTALEAEGIAHPNGCRMGLCNTCACPKLSGTTQNLIDGNEQHEADSALRVCVSSARSNLILDI